MENILGIWDRLNCKTQLIRLFDLKQFYLTIKTEYRKMKMEKNWIWKYNVFHRAL